MKASIQDIEQGGFLPDEDPIVEWEADEFSGLNFLMRDLPRLLEIQADMNLAVESYLPRFTEGFERLKCQLTKQEKTALRRDLAFLITACLSKDDQTPPPELITAPFEELSREAGVKPALNYHLYVLYNFYRPDLQKPRKLGNLRTLRRFTKSIDEEWFVITHLVCEAIFGEIMETIIHCHEFAVNGDVKYFAQCLTKIAYLEIKLARALKKLPMACHPVIYHDCIRPYLRLTGCRCEVEEQSPFTQALDICFEVKHCPKALKSFDEASQYLTLAPLNVLNILMSVPSLKQWTLSLKSEPARHAFNFAVEKFCQIRKIQHIFYCRYVYNREAAQGGGGLALIEPWRQYLAVDVLRAMINKEHD